MTIHDQIKDEKIQYNINREAAKISALMALLKGSEMVFKAFESGIFSRLEQSEQSCYNDEYTSSKLNNDLITSSNTWHTSFSCCSSISLYTQKKEQDSKYYLLNKCINDYQ